jgi:hypothetical protein
MTLGIETFRGPRELWLDRLLLNPFVDEHGSHTGQEIGAKQKSGVTA